MTKLMKIQISGNYCLDLFLVRIRFYFQSQKEDGEVGKILRQSGGPWPLVSRMCMFAGGHMLDGVRITTHGACNC